MQRTVLVIPCFDEAERLDDEAFLACLEERPDVDLVFVDDGSRDATRERLEALAAKGRERISVLHQWPNRGKAEAVRRGMQAAFGRRPAFAGYWDCDLATPLEELGRFLERANARPEVQLLLGARVALLGHSIERSALRHYLGRVLATFASGVLGLPVYDTQCGAKLLRCSALTESLFAEPFCVDWTFDVELLARLVARQRAAGSPPEEAVQEVPLLRWRDVPGSKVKPWDFFVGLAELARIHRRYPRRAPALRT